MSKSIEATIDRIEEDICVFILENNEKLILPIGKLPTGCKQGDVVILTIEKSKGKTEERENLAKDVLNEILNED